MIDTKLSVNACSRSVVSSQQGIHPRLTALLQKHRRSSYRRPIAAHTLAVFKKLDARVRARERSIILDSGCGTGASSINLARQYPESLIVGIDKSAARLARRTREELPENVCIVRADCVDLWRLACAHNWPLAAHYLLYPNPWPKREHLKRRWHGHPVFVDLIALGGRLELRSNWRVYVEEFAYALRYFGIDSSAPERFEPSEVLSPFERKYHASAHSLYRLSATLEAHA